MIMKMPAVHRLMLGLVVLSLLGASSLAAESSRRSLWLGGSRGVLPGSLVVHRLARGGFSDSEEDLDDDDEDEEDDETDQGEEEEAATTGSVGSRKKARPLNLRETPLDRALRVSQSLGRVVGKHHDKLAKHPVLGVVFSNEMFIQLILVWTLMKSTGKIDYNDRGTIFGIRVWYSASQIFIQLAYLLIRRAIELEDDQTEVVQSNKAVDSLLGQVAGAAAGEGEAGGGSQGGLQEVASKMLQSKTTAKEYDLRLAKQRSASQFPSMLIMYILHFKADWHRAVLYAPVAPLVRVFADPLFQIHILGREGEGPLSRPFQSQQQRMLAEMQEKQMQLSEDVEQGGDSSGSGDDDEAGDATGSGEEGGGEEEEEGEETAADDEGSMDRD